MDENYRKQLGKTIINRYNINVTNDNLRLGKGVDFKTMLQYIKDGGRDEHWRMQYFDKCQPCLISYDHIVRTETLDEDSAYIIVKQLAGRGLHTKRRQWRKQSADRIYFERKLPEYGDIGGKLFAHIVKQYKDDMEWFGYNYWRHNGSVLTNCNIISGSQNQHCC
jgi:hypothetical protein